MKLRNLATTPRITITKTLISPSPGLGLLAARMLKAPGRESEILIAPALAKVGAVSRAKISPKLINFIVFSVPEQKPTSCVQIYAVVGADAAYKLLSGGTL
jgi:hypothetical protein